MCCQYLDGDIFLEALRDTTEQLRVNREKLNLINVFPAPDGDTGNNLWHTLEAALQEAEQLAGTPLDSVVEAASRGARNGSCGSSGAIFAQFLKGWAVTFERVERAGIAHLVRALKEGTQKAYAAVLQPVEGTILTVARKAAEAAQQAAPGGDMAETLLAVYQNALQALRETPRMLEALGKRAVVDAGGWGLLIFFRALLKAMRVEPEGSQADYVPDIAVSGEREGLDFMHPYDLEFSFGSFGKELETKVRKLLGKIGSDLITRAGDNCLHVHVHTDQPLTVLEQAVSLAPLRELIIRDMRLQCREIPEHYTEKTGCRVYVLGRDPGFLALFVMAGAEAAVSISADGKTGQLLREAAEKNSLVLTSADKNFIAPDGAPVFLLEEDARVLSTLLSLNPEEMPSAAQIYEAARYPRVVKLMLAEGGYSVSLNGVEMNSGKLEDLLLRVVVLLEPREGEVLTIYYGRAVEFTRVEFYLRLIQKQYPFLETSAYYGGQEAPLVISLE